MFDLRLLLLLFGSCSVVVCEQADKIIYLFAKHMAFRLVVVVLLLVALIACGFGAVPLRCPSQSKRERPIK